MKRKLYFILFSLLSFFVANVYAQNIPQWISEYFEAKNSYEYSKAEEILSNNFNSESSDCCYIVALSHIDKLNYDWAIQWLEQAISKHNSEGYYWKSTFYLKLADLYNYLGKYDEALDCMIKAKDDKLLNKRVSFDDFIKIASQYKLLEQYAKAEDYLYFVLNNDNNNADAKIDLAYLYFNNAAKEDSVLLDSLANMLINEVITLRSSYSKAYFARAQYYQKRKEDYKLAINDYLAYLYYDKNQTDNTEDFYYCAMKEFQYAVTKINEWVSFCNTKETREKSKYFFIGLRAKVYENNAYYREAIEDYTEVIEYDSEGTNPLWALSNRGDCYSEIYEFKKAIEDYTKCIDINSDIDEYIYIRRADAYTELGMYDDAISDYTKATRVSAYNHYIGYAYYRRGWIKEFLKDDYGALRDYNKGIEADNDYAYLYLMRGETYIRLNEKEKAKQDFNRVLELDNTITNGTCRHYALLFLGDTLDAIDWMEKILKSDYANSGDFYDAACLYARMGNKIESLNYLRKAFESGYRRIAHVKIDDDLDLIRNMPEYNELIEKYEAQSNVYQIEVLLKEQRSKMSDEEKLNLLREFKLTE